MVEENVEKNESKETIFSRTGFILGVISIIISFIPLVNYLTFIIGTLAIIFGLFSFWSKGKKGAAFIGIVLAIISIIVTNYVLNTALDKYLDKISDVMIKLNSKINREIVYNSDDVLKNELEVIIGTFEVETSDYGYGAVYNSSKLQVKLKNKSDKMKSFDVAIEAVDENGNRITEDNVYVSRLNAGQSYETEAFYYTSEEMAERLKNATFRVIDASSY